MKSRLKTTKATNPPLVTILLVTNPPLATVPIATDPSLAITPLATISVLTVPTTIPTMATATVSIQIPPPATVSNLATVILLVTNSLATITASNTPAMTPERESENCQLRGLPILFKQVKEGNARPFHLNWLSQVSLLSQGDQDTEESPIQPTQRTLPRAPSQQASWRPQRKTAEVYNRDRTRKYEQYFQETNILPISEYAQVIEPKTVSLVI